MRAIELLILDGFALQAMDQVETADFYELVIEGQSYRPQHRPDPPTPTCPIDQRS